MEVVVCLDSSISERPWTDCSLENQATILLCISLTAYMKGNAKFTMTMRIKIRIVSNIHAWDNFCPNWSQLWHDLVTILAQFGHSFGTTWLQFRHDFVIILARLVHNFRMTWSQFWHDLVTTFAHLASLVKFLHDLVKFWHDFVKLLIGTNASVSSIFHISEVIVIRHFPKIVLLHIYSVSSGWNFHSASLRIAATQRENCLPFLSIIWWIFFLFSFLRFVLFSFPFSSDSSRRYGIAGSGHFHLPLKC